MAHELPRRRVLLGGLVLLGGAAAGCGTPRPTLPSGPVEVGAVTDFAAGTWTLLPDLGIIVARDGGGLYAYSAACTHLGCLIDPPDESGRAECPCHGSAFDGNGAVLQGPAQAPLSHLELTVKEGAVTVDASKKVPAVTRTAA